MLRAARQNRSACRRHLFSASHVDLLESLEPRLLLAAVPIVNVVASRHLASETNPNTSGLGQLTFTRTGSRAAGLTVNYSVGGTATAGADYAALSGTVTFDPGKATARVLITPVADAIAEANETVIATITADAAYDIGRRAAATVTIRDNAPTVKITATRPRASEINAGTASARGRFTLTRTGPLTNPLTVDYTITGTATGADFANLPGSVTFLAGKATATIILDPLTDAIAEGTETVILTLDPGATPAFKTIPNRVAATVTIADAQPTIAIMAVRNFSEGGGTGAFRIVRTGGDIHAPVTVDFTTSGTATSGVDFTALPSGVTLGAGQRSVLVPITPLADLDAEGTETVIVSLTPDPSFSLDPNVARQSVTLNLADVPPLNFFTDTSFNVDGASFLYLAVSPDSSVSTALIDVQDAGLLGSTVTLTSNGPTGFNDVRSYNFVDDGTDVTLVSRSLFIPDLTPIPGVFTGTSGVTFGSTSSNFIANSINTVPATITSPQLVLVPSTFTGGTFTSTAPATMVSGNNQLASGTVTARTRLVGTAQVVSPLGTFTANRIDITLGTAMTTLNSGGVIGTGASQFGMTEQFSLYLVPGIGIIRATVGITQTAITPGNFPITTNMNYTGSLFSYAV